MSKSRIIAARLDETMAQARAAVAELEDLLWEKISAIREAMENDRAPFYSEMVDAHDTIENLRMDIDFNNVPACVADLWVVQGVSVRDGRPDRRRRLLDAAAAVMACCYVAWAHADRRSTSDEDRAAVQAWMNELDTADERVADVVFPR